MCYNRKRCVHSYGVEYKDGGDEMSVKLGYSLESFKFVTVNFLEGSLFWLVLFSLNSEWKVVC